MEFPKPADVYYVSIKHSTLGGAKHCYTVEDRIRSPCSFFLVYSCSLHHRKCDMFITDVHGGSIRRRTRYSQQDEAQQLLLEEKTTSPEKIWTWLYWGREEGGGSTPPGKIYKQYEMATVMTEDCKMMVKTGPQRCGDGL